MAAVARTELEPDLDLAWDVAYTTLSKRGTPGVIYSTAQAWQLATAYLDARVVAGRDQSDQCPPETMRALQALEEVRLQDDLLEWYLDSVRSAFGLVQASILPLLDRPEAQARVPEDMLELLNLIGFWMRAWQRPIETFWATSPPLSSYRRCFLSSLYNILPPTFAPALTSYLRFLLHSASEHPVSSSTTMSTLISLLDRYDPLLFGLIYEEIEKRVHQDCAGQFDGPKLEALGAWLNGPVMGWVSGIYAKSVEGGQEEAKKMLKPTFSRFEYHVHKTLCLLRTTEMFDMIVDYPDSKPALDDLKICLYKTDQRSILVHRLRGLMARRLLHPGADTKDIITQYISTIRSLRILEPQGVLLSRVAEPIRKYLRTREDTIRCIVSSLIEEGNELVEELAASDAKQVHDSKDEAENYNDPKWTPDPVDAPPEFRKSKSSDIIQLLVSIYDSKDVFIKELQVSLAQRLLAIKDYALDREIKNVEILKLRFGDASLQGCEVMIKDLQDSKRIDHHIHEHSQVPMHATIVSRLFWPSFQQAPLKLPPQLGRVQSEYEQTFVRLKPDKKLRWLPQLGTVNVTVELSDRSLTLDATPVQAAILELFGQKDVWNADDLATKLRVPDIALVRNALYFWNNLGVLKNLGDDWKLLEEVDKNEEPTVSHVVEESAPAVQSVEALRVEQMRVFWQYIQGMLTNLGALPTARIHTTLNMLVSTYKGRTKDELQAFLEAMQTEGLVEKSGKSWKIVR